MRCHRARSLFSSYLDGTVSGKQMQAIAEHLRHCSACSAEYTALQRTQQLVAGLGRKQPPPELALRLRIALSQAAAQKPRRRLQGVLVRLENFTDAFMLPATAGLISAIIVFGVLIGFFALPAQLSASRDDVPTKLYTPPQLVTMPAELAVGSASSSNSEPIVVETLVDANGRVQDYRILSGPADPRGLELELNNIMIFTTFRPATSFGVPTQGRAVLSFAMINVRG